MQVDATTITVQDTSDRFWGHYLADEALTHGEFVLLLDSRGSCSCRRYDARSGKQLSLRKISATSYRIGFLQIHGASKKLPSPGKVRVEDIEDSLTLEILNHLQRSAGVPLSSPSKHVEKLGMVGAVSMLYGVDEIINEALGVGDVGYKSKTAARRLSVSPPKFAAFPLVSSLYARILKNWDQSPGRSKEIWRWRAIGDISKDNTSPEKTLEKAIVNANCGYVNQIPAASGLLARYEERHVCIDLGYQRGKSYELIELKAGINCDTPLSAAFQILSYGLLYCFARLNKYDLNVPYQAGVLAASRIDLKVLGPCSIYDGYNLEWLGQALELGVTDFCRDRFGSELEMHFSFEAFPQDFRWPGTDPRDLSRYCEQRSQYAWRQMCSS